jgi:uncharacterized membrane protein
MMGCTVKRHVNAPVDTVFQYATDLRNAPKRIRGIKKLDVLTDGPIRVGTRFRETRIMFKREATEEMEITAMDPPNGYVVGAESHGCRYRSEFTFTPNGSGTEVVMTFQGQPLTFMTKIMAFMMRPMMKSCMKMIAADLDDLKAAIEREEPTRSA